MIVIGSMASLFLKKAIDKAIKNINAVGKKIIEFIFPLLK